MFMTARPLVVRCNILGILRVLVGHASRFAGTLWNLRHIFKPDTSARKRKRVVNENYVAALGDLVCPSATLVVVQLMVDHEGVHGIGCLCDLRFAEILLAAVVV